MAERLTAQERQSLISKWISPATEAEAQRQARAERMVREAIDEYPAFAPIRSNITVGAKGSYPNNTNIRSDSDVDIKVQLNDPYHADFHPMVNWWRKRLMTDYGGPWTPDVLREEVYQALTAKFGTVDAEHNVAFYVAPVPGSRPSIDVVPCFRYLQYTDVNCTQFNEGSIVYTRGGKEIVNWPDQQLANGRAKNTRTSNRYKFVVRTLKSVENALVAQGVIEEVPSYFSECLVYNVPDDVLKAGSFDDAVRESLRHLNRELGFWMGHSQTMMEPNEIKKLFGPTQKWTVEDGRELVKQAWTYLNYG